MLTRYFTITELPALARFYATPEGRAIGRKFVAFTAVGTTALEAELVAWARAVVARVPRQSIGFLSPTLRPEG